MIGCIEVREYKFSAGLFRRSILAGVLIGAAKYCEEQSSGGVIGAALFSVGLLGVFASDALLYTGRIGFAKLSDVPELLIMLSSNLLAAALLGCIHHLGVPVQPCTVDQVIGQSVLCGMCIKIAAMDRRPVVVILSVMAFVLGGGMHCVVQAYIHAPMWRIYLAAAGNSAGALIVSGVRE